MAAIRRDLAAMSIALILICIASGDVSVSRAYFSSGSECYESVYLHDMEYTNSASIWNANYYAAATANSSPDSEEARIADQAYIITRKGMNGASIQSDGFEGIQFSNYISGGGPMGFEYNMTADDDPASLYLSAFCSDARFSEDISRMSNSLIAGKLQSYSTGFVSVGDGRSTGSGPSYFNDRVKLQFLDKFASTESFLSAPSQEGRINYTWSSISGKGEIAKSYLRIDAFEGIISGMAIKGHSFGVNSSLDDKYSPLSYADGIPLKRNASDIDKVVYMIYVLNNTK